MLYQNSSVVRLSTGYHREELMNETPYGYCGMPCALCNRHRIEGTSKCIGCSHDGYYGDSCKIKRCCRGRELPHCALCAGYPCEQIQQLEDFNDLQTSGCWTRIAQDIQRNGFDDWHETLREKSDLLTQALDTYNNGRMKKFLCELFIQEDLGMIKDIMEQAKRLEGTRKEISEGFKRIVTEQTKDKDNI